MSSRELRDWEVYGAIEPFGEEQDNRRAALLAHVIVAVNTQKGKKAPDPDVFLRMLRPDDSPDAQRMGQTPEELAVTFAAAAQRRTLRRKTTPDGERDR